MTTHTPENLKSVQDELKWITLREGQPQTFWERSKNKFLGNPLVPLGCLATAGVLGRGLYYLRKGNSVMQQRYMRYRVGTQGATIIAIVIGVLFVQSKQ